MSRWRRGKQDERLGICAASHEWKDGTKLPICRVSGRLRPTPVRLAATLRGSGSCGVTVYFFFFEAVQEVVAVVDSIMGGAIEIHVFFTLHAER